MVQIGRFGQLALLFYAGWVVGDRLAVNAGILPYYYDSQGDAYFLIGKERNNSWADFGGHYEKSDKNPEYTAMREFSEETRYVFGKFAAGVKRSNKKINIRRYLAKSIEYIEPRITAKFIHPKGSYYLFLAQVDYIPALFFSQARKLLHYDKKDFEWVPAADFMRAIQYANKYEAFYVGKKIRKRMVSILQYNYNAILSLLYS